MSFSRRHRIARCVLLATLVALLSGEATRLTAGQPSFELTEQAALADGNSLTNAIADFDNDGDLDIFVGFSQQRACLQTSPSRSDSPITT